jgi:hypothetical protein
MLDWLRRKLKKQGKPVEVSDSRAGSYFRDIYRDAYGYDPIPLISQSHPLPWNNEPTGWVAPDQLDNATVPDTQVSDCGDPISGDCASSD